MEGQVQAHDSGIAFNIFLSFIAITDSLFTKNKEFKIHRSTRD